MNFFQREKTSPQTSQFVAKRDVTHFFFIQHARVGGGGGGGGGGTLRYFPHLISVSNCTIW